MRTDPRSSTRLTRPWTLIFIFLSAWFSPLPRCPSGPFQESLEKAPAESCAAAPERIKAGGRARRAAATPALLVKRMNTRSGGPRPRLPSAAWRASFVNPLWSRRRRATASPVDGTLDPAAGATFAEVVRPVKSLHLLRVLPGVPTCGVAFAHARAVSFKTPSSVPAGRAGALRAAASTARRARSFASSNRESCSRRQWRRARTMATGSRRRLRGALRPVRRELA